MIGLVGWSAEQHMKGIADDFDDRAIMCEDDLGHAAQIIVKELGKRRRLHRFGKMRETGDVGKERCNLAPFTYQRRYIDVTGEPLGQSGREVP